MRRLGEISWLAGFVRPEIAVITNVAPVHLELLGSIENVARGKAELVAALPPGGVAVVPEEPLLEPYLQRSDIEIRRFAPGEGPAVSISEGARWRSRRASPLRHQLDNALAALIVCELLGVPLPEGRLEVDFGRLREELIELPGEVLLLNDCYNASPNSMRAALAHLAELAGGRRRIAVLGEMAELGDQAAASTIG